MFGRKSRSRRCSFGLTKEHQGRDSDASCHSSNQSERGQALRRPHSGREAAWEKLRRGIRGSAAPVAGGGSDNDSSLRRSGCDRGPGHHWHGDLEGHKRTAFGRYICLCWGWWSVIRGGCLCESGAAVRKGDRRRGGGRGGYDNV